MAVPGRGAQAAPLLTAVRGGLGQRGDRGLPHGSAGRRPAVTPPSGGAASSSAAAATGGRGRGREPGPGPGPRRPPAGGGRLVPERRRRRCPGGRPSCCRGTAPSGTEAPAPRPPRPPPPAPPRPRGGPPRGRDGSPRQPALGRGEKGHWDQPRGKAWGEETSCSTRVKGTKFLVFVSIFLLLDNPSPDVGLILEQTGNCWPMEEKKRKTHTKTIPSA